MIIPTANRPAPTPAAQVRVPLRAGQQDLAVQVVVLPAPAPAPLVPAVSGLTDLNALLADRLEDATWEDAEWC